MACQNIVTFNLVVYMVGRYHQLPVPFWLNMMVRAKFIRFYKNYAKKRGIENQWIHYKSKLDTKMLSIQMFKEQSVAKIS